MSARRSARSVVVSPENAPLALWDVVAGRSERPWPRHAGFDTCLALLPGARFLVSGGSHRVVRLWDPSTGRVVREMNGHGDAVTAVAAGASRIVSASRDGTVRIWALEDGRCLGTLRGHEGRVLAVAIDEAQARVVSGGEDGTVRDWGLASHEVVRVKDARSPVAPLRVPYLCGKCHQEGTPVQRQREIHESNIIENYSESMHGEALL